MNSVTNKIICKTDNILFATQVSLIFIVVCVSLINLTFSIGNFQLWTLLLSSCLGYIMPNPKLKILNLDEIKKNEESIQLN